MKCTLPLITITLISCGACFAQNSAEQDQRKTSKQTVVAQAAAKDTEDDAESSFTPQDLPKRSMLDGMTILCSAGQWTIVPVNAFLAKPEFISRYVIEKPEGKYTQWDEFFRRNRGWIVSHEVSLETIKGETPLSDKKLQAFQRSRKVVVATYNNSPVSVLRPKPESKE